ncbi:MAG: 16S rRNA (cytosine(967)-C(5))-methyltransferase RsmB [Comamonadaceae bacterium]|nr:MAG: 16S rRNA (cytosine(967)-C(5))-methyltransferase RsmB [Comamonadaceae bacterium]
MAPPLWLQLQHAAAVLAAVRSGSSATAAMERVDAGLRPGVQALVFQALRWWGRGEALRRRLAQRTPPPAADALLCAALALGWDPDLSPYEPFTLVDQTVEAAKRQPGTRAQASFINACLRRFLRERDELLAATAQEPVAQWNHPRWWIERLRHDHPKAWQRVLQANDSAAPLTLRINACRTSVERYLPALAAQGIEARRVAETGLELAQARPVQQLPGFEAGEFSVQDAAAQLAAPLLLEGLRPGQAGAPLRLLDACAAPGGKTAHLLERVQGPAHVLALEVDAQRARRIDDTLARLGLQAEVRVADAGRTQDWWDGQPFDGVLLDAPCTASGIVRRHPDVRWLRRESDVQQLAVQQAMLLAALWPTVRPGGRLLYCTCSVFREEGEHQIDAFLARNSEAQLLPSPGHLLPQARGGSRGLPDNALGEHDGFFYALLQKSIR